MDVSNPSQRLAALRLLTSSITPSDGRPVSADGVRSAASVVRNHSLLAAAPAGGQHEAAVGKLVGAVQDLLQQSEKDSDIALGVELVGLCCSEAGPQLFTRYQSEWGLGLLRSLSKGFSAKEKSVQALCQLLLRAQSLDSVKGVRREASALVSKLLPAVNSMLKTQSQADKLAALMLLSCVLCVLPTSVKSSMSAIETGLSSLVLTWDTSDTLKAQAISCMAKLPNVTASAEDWQDLAASCAMGVHRLLDEAMPSGYVLIKDTVREAALGVLSKGHGRWSSSWGKALGVDGEMATSRSPVQRTKLMLALLDLLGNLLSEDTSAPVVVPAMSLLLLATRILSVDPRAFPQSTEAVEFLSLWLPELQAAVLSVLTVMARNAGFQLAPSLAAMARLLGDQMRIIAAGEGGANHSTCCTVRDGVYTCAAYLLAIGGPAVLLKLSETAVQCIKLELFTAPAAPEGEPEAKKPRLEKEGKAIADILAEGMASSASFKPQHSAAQLLRAMLDHGGSLMSPKSRTELDTLAVQLALACHNAAAATARGQGRSQARLKELQLASYSALLASVQAPCQHRPLYLAQALEVFNSGVHDRCPQVAQISLAAVSVIESALNPRALPFPRLLKLAQQPVDVPEDIDLGRPRLWSSYTASPGLSGCLQLPLASAASRLGTDTAGQNTDGGTRMVEGGANLHTEPPEGHMSALRPSEDGTKGTETAPPKAATLGLSIASTAAAVATVAGDTALRPPVVPVATASAPLAQPLLAGNTADRSSLPPQMSVDYPMPDADNGSKQNTSPVLAKGVATGASPTRLDDTMAAGEEDHQPPATGNAMSGDMGEESADDESLPDINSGADSDSD